MFTARLPASKHTQQEIDFVRRIHGLEELAETLSIRLQIEYTIEDSFELLRAEPVVLDKEFNNGNDFRLHRVRKQGLPSDNIEQ